MRHHHLLLALALAALALAPVAGRADDHLFEATRHGLSPDSQPFQVNPAGHGGDLAPGQGSPFTGDDRQTPATDTDAANAHARLRPRG
ncbi:hypothetical protein Rumeso_03366 [Rubellimicrobium mesophilum DSM 19309]|uniref:Uncharacterized protein n=1 Tax=Rubellimicrobium mesophilum DSM 19309 TaxID=442562 RepID=A0A017HLN7_9RHOB|nr:hypothetical protein [Rubellimicrobium mesophilum]EYD75038.1 hypothetical protein Rumeso_03366 [Rubellimicrobium mesophilum DSM 19309]